MTTIERLGRWARGMGTAAAVTLLGAGCASAPVNQPDQTVTQIIVDNDQAVAGADVYLVPEVGDRTRLGRVKLDQRKYFEANVPVGDRFVLQAVVGDDAITSPTFTLTTAQTVEWQVDQNEIELGGEDSVGRPEVGDGGSAVPAA